MVFKIYKTKSPNNVVDKILSSEHGMTGTLREETNTEKPNILIKGNLLDGYNYAYIPAFKRFYYITSSDSVRNGITRINMEVDPLMSFSADIKQLSAIISKQQQDGNLTNKMYNDGTFKNTPEQEISILEFPNGKALYTPDQNPYYILTCY